MVAYKEDVSHLVRLKNAGYNPKMVLDIGTSNGEFFNECKHVFSSAQYHLFEARKIEETTIRETIEASEVPVKLHYGFALGNFNGSKTFHQIDAGSSFYPEVTKFKRKKIRKSVKHFGDYLIDSNINLLPSTFIKLDTQGSELDILDGLYKVQLDKIEVIQIEVALIEYNRNAPSFNDVQNIMNYFDYVLYDFIPSFRRQSDQALFHADAIYVKDTSNLRKKNYFWEAERTMGK